MNITFTVNGTAWQVPASRGDELLIDFLHDDLGLTGTKLCCGVGVCRACTVAIAASQGEVEEPAAACSTPLSGLDGAAVTTIEGVSAGPQLLPVQEAFLQHFSFQCGYCTPGFVMASKIFLDGLALAPPPDDLDAAIVSALGDHICRCSGYVRYVAALRDVATAVIAAKTNNP